MEPDTTREDLLLSRVTDRSDTAGDWAELEALAAGDAAVWRRLHAQLAADAMLRTAAAPALAVADSVDLGLPAGGRPALGRPMLAPALGMAGWLAALVFALLWFAGAGSRSGSGSGSGGGAGDHFDATAAWIPAGDGAEQVRMLVDAEPTADGRGLVVRALRTVVEEKIVDEVFQLAPDGRSAVRTQPIGWQQARAGSDF